MHANYGKTRFESDNTLNLEPTTLTRERLDDAYDLLHEHVPGCENLRRITNIIRRNGLILKERSNIVDILSSNNDAKMDMKIVINEQQQQQLVLKGLELLVALAYVHNIKVYYFSTRRHAQVINANGERTVAVLHHIDSFLNQNPIWFELEDMIQYTPHKQRKHPAPAPARAPPSKTAAKLKENIQTSPHTYRKNLLSREEIIKAFERGAKKFLQRDLENALKASTSLEKALSALQKYYNKHNNRRAVPHIYSDIQSTLIKENPNLEGVNRSWFGDQVKNCPNYDQLNEFKNLGNQLIEEVRGFFENCTWEDVVLSQFDNVASGSTGSSKDANEDVDEEDIDDDGEDDVSDDDDDDDSNRPKKIQETITFSLRSILRSELDYNEILSSFQKEQERVGRCLSELGKGVDFLTNKIITGDIATLYGETIDSYQVDLQDLAPEFDFGPNTKPTVAVAPIPSITTQQKMIYDGVYTFGHFSNILSGCIGNSIREKSDRPTYKDIRNMINQSNTVSAQEDMSFTGGINNALREFNTACKNLWTRKRHDRDLRVLTTALFRINLAPDRVKRYMQRLTNFAKKKQAVQMQKETTESDDISCSSIPYIKGRLKFFLHDLMWSIAREREAGVTDMLYKKVTLWFNKLENAKCQNSTINKTEKELAQNSPFDIVVSSEETEDEDEEEYEEEEKAKETPNKTIRALVAITKSLLEKQGGELSADDIKNEAFKGTKINEEECETAARIVNFLRPYYFPKSTNDKDDDDSEEDITIHQCAPLAAITNTIVQLVVPQQNVWSMAPQVEPNDHPIHISSDVIYTLFSSNFVIPSSSPKAAITSKREALDPKKRHEVFGAFFNMNKIRQALASRELSFKYRITYSNRHTIRVLGFGYKHDKSKSIENTTSSDKEDVDMDTEKASSSTSSVAKEGVEPKTESKDDLKGKGAQGKGKAGRGRSRKAHNISNKKNKNKKRKAASKGQQVSQKKQKTVKDEGMKLHLENLNARVTNLTNALAVLRRKLLPLERNRADIGREFRKVTKTKQWDSVMYKELRMARQRVTGIEEEIGMTQRNLNNTKSEIYKIEMSFKGKELDADKYEDPSQTWVQGKILNYLKNKEEVAVTGIDPGIVVSATAITSTTGELFNSLSSYTNYSPTTLPTRVPSHRDANLPPEKIGQTSSIKSATTVLASTSSSQSSSSLPPSHTTTTEQIKKDRRLPRSNLYTANRKRAATFESVHEIRRQRFKRENVGKGQSDTDKRNKEARTREIRQKFYHQKLSSSWRRRGSKSNIQFFGTFKSFNSRIKKHRRGANSRLACELDAPENDKVIPTNEFRSSKTCPTCHSPTKQQKYRRGDNLLSANGSLRCTNRSCPDFHRNTYNRDDVGAFNISVIGFSKAISSNNQPIPAFCRSMTQTYSVSPSLEKHMT